MRTANPAFREGTFAPANWPGIEADRRFGGDTGERAVVAPAAMTVGGTIIKTGILLAVCASVAMVAWNMASSGVVSPLALLLGGLVGGLVLGLIIGMKPTAAPYLAIPYAVFEGAMLGAFSLVIAAKIGAAGTAMVFQAILLTFGIMAALLVAFSAGVIRLGSTATKCVVVATGGIGILYLVSMVMNMMGWGSIGFIHEGGALGIGFSLFVIVLASLNLVLDFQFIEGGAKAGAPKYMEWYGAFGLLVTLVWLYIEILRLLAKLNRK